MYRTFIIVIAITVSFATASYADSWPAPSPRIIASQHGRHALKLVPNHPSISMATGELFTIDVTSGEDLVLWKTKLINIPVRVFVSERNGQVVTVDTYARLGYEHAIVVYDNEGNVIADYDLEDILSEEVIREHVKGSSSSRWWTSNATFKFRGVKQFIVTTEWGQVIAIDLKSGRLQLPEAD